MLELRAMPLPDPSLRARVDVDPDEEALRLMSKLCNRLQVAKSFARIAAGMVQEQASHASSVLRVAAGVAKVQVAPQEAAVRARVEQVRRVARAAAEAAVHVTTTEARRYTEGLATKTEAEPAPPPTS